jgi:pyruvate formate lyase activating enzyme
MDAHHPLIFDIKRDSLEDGPGIRTTVFFKGCNFNCVWCHNPESVDPHPEIGFYPRHCIQCGDCVKICPVSACRLENPSLIDRETCTRCGDCAAACPSKALRLLGCFYPVDELLDILLRDRMFYQVSGGGVTLSGGEPTLYLDYCAEVLGKLKELGLHTALQTNGSFQWEEFREKILPQVDLVMVDVKMADGRKHQEYTGQDNAPILENLRRLLQEKPDAVLPRIPLIPAFTASSGNLEALANLFQGLGVQRCSLLPYNPTWFHKAESIDKSVEARLSPQMLTAAEIACCRELFSWAELVDFDH